MRRFQHVVLFQFPKALAPEDEAEMLRQVRAWPRGYQYCLFSEFETEERMKAYQAHPAHQVFGSWVYARDCQVLAFDYEVDEATRITGP